VQVLILHGYINLIYDNEVTLFSVDTMAIFKVDPYTGQVQSHKLYSLRSKLLLLGQQI
jgi:hypothetical protein